MRRLNFLLPDLATTRKVVEDLLLARIEDRHIHVVANEGVALDDLPEAESRSDFVPAMEKGLAVGGVTGTFTGLVAVTFPPAGLALGGGAVLATAVLGAGFGAWISAMIGASAPDSRLKEFEDALQAGKILMLVDVPEERAEEIEKLIKRCHPKAEIAQGDATTPKFS